MRLTFAYELADGTTGHVTTRAIDLAVVERKTGDKLTRGLGFEHCARLVHNVLTREAKTAGGKGVPPYDLWLENDLIDVEHLASPPAEIAVSSNGTGDTDDVPFVVGDSISP